MRINNKAKAGIAAGVLLVASGVLTVAMVGPADAASVSSASAPVAVSKGKGTPISQTGLVSSPVTAQKKGVDKTGKTGGEVAFKVTGDGRTEAWIVTDKTQITRDGKPVAPSAISQGDHVTISGVDDGKIAIADKVVDQG